MTIIFEGKPIKARPLKGGESIQLGDFHATVSISQLKPRPEDRTGQYKKVSERDTKHRVDSMGAGWFYLRPIQ